MSGGMGSGNDTDVTLYSADGRLFQIEYAGKCVETSGTCIGICCQDGVVVAAEKLVMSRMLEPGSNPRCLPVDRQAGICVCGSLPDGKMVTGFARQEAAEYRDQKASIIPAGVLAGRIGLQVHEFTLFTGYRPVGCSLLLASFSDEGPQLYMIDPSGTVAGYHACAAGKGKTVAKTHLEAIDFSTITCAQAIETAAKIIFEAHDYAKDKLWELEMAWVCDASDRKFVKVPEHLVPAKPAVAPS